MGQPKKADPELLRVLDADNPPQKFQRPTPEQIAEAMASAKKAAADVESRLKIKLQTVETSHFIIFTDWDRPEYDFLKSHVEPAYAALGHQLDFPTHLNIFVGK